MISSEQTLQGQDQMDLQLVSSSRWGCRNSLAASLSDGGRGRPHFCFKSQRCKLFIYLFFFFYSKCNLEGGFTASCSSRDGSTSQTSESRRESNLVDPIRKSRRPAPCTRRRNGETRWDTWRAATTRQNTLRLKKVASPFWENSAGGLMNFAQKFYL